MTHRIAGFRRLDVAARPRIAPANDINPTKTGLGTTVTLVLVGACIQTAIRRHDPLGDGAEVEIRLGDARVLTRTHVQVAPDSEFRFVPGILGRPPKEPVTDPVFEAVSQRDQIPVDGGSLRPGS